MNLKIITSMAMLVLVTSSIDITSGSHLTRAEHVEHALKGLAERLHLHQSVGELVPELRQRSTSLLECYESEVNGLHIDLSDPGLSLKRIALTYYKAFPEKKIDAQSVASLLHSAASILRTCLQSGQETAGARFGFTSLSDKSAEEFSALNGARVPFSWKHDRRPVSSANCDKTQKAPENFDWRSKNAVTPPKDQEQCGACWAFAITGSVESALILAGKGNSDNSDLSEQQLIDCVRDDGCSGGQSQDTLEWIKANGQTAECDWQYRADDNDCPGPLPVVAEISDYCVKRARFSFFGGGNLKEDTIIQSLINYGPLYIALNGDGIQHYRGGVYDSNSCSKHINHAVLLIGYTPEAWILKNSWGASWGEHGFFRMKRGKNLCGIQTEIAYPLI